MTNASMTPGSRPRRGVIGVLALLGAGALTTGLVLAAGEASDPPRVAGAVELATFTSCEDLAAWGADASAGMSMDDSSEDLMATAGGDVAVSARASDGAVMEEGEASAANDIGGGGAGFDPGIQDPSAPPATQAPATTTPATTTPASSTTTPPDTEPETTEPDTTEPETTEPETTEATDPEDGDDEDDDEPADDETNVIVEGVDEIDLVDRLTEDVVLVSSASTMAVVDLEAAEVVDSTPVPWDAQITYDAEAGVAWVVGHRDVGGVLIERYAVDTESLASEGSWTTTGSLVDARRVGDELHVVATDGFTGGPPMPVDGIGDGGTFPEEDAGASTASSEAVPFSGGPVPCDEVLHPTGPSDPTATLLATLPATGAVEPVRATEVVGSGSLVHVTTGAIYLATPQWSGNETTTGIHRFDLATLEPTGSGSVAGTLLDDFSMSEHEGVLRVATTADQLFMGGGVAVDGPAVNPIVPAAEGDEAGSILNEIVVLDTEGALDEIGRTERFGHPGETLHGIRFAGSTAYAVTFLQTDPFYVVDLSDPTDPRVVGEVELPGFSSYLHPLGGGLVVGFGPGTSGMAAKLFDVSDPTSPEVVSELTLDDESAVAYDHHAYLDLGDGRFAVPTTSYRAELTSSVLVVDTAGGQLAEESRLSTTTAEPAARVLSMENGWALLAGPEIVILDDDGAAARITL